MYMFTTHRKFFGTEKKKKKKNPSGQVIWISNPFILIYISLKTLGLKITGFRVH